jgi:hypothetical protein
MIAKWVRLVIFCFCEGHGTGRRRAEAALWRAAKAEKSREPAGWKTCATRFCAPCRFGGAVKLRPGADAKNRKKLQKTGENGFWAIRGIDWEYPLVE